MAAVSAQLHGLEIYVVFFSFSAQAQGICQDQEAGWDARRLYVRWILNIVSQYRQSFLYHVPTDKTKIESILRKNVTSKFAQSLVSSLSLRQHSIFIQAWLVVNHCPSHIEMCVIYHFNLPSEWCRGKEEGIALVASKEIERKHIIVSWGHKN